MKKSLVLLLLVFQFSCRHSDDCLVATLDRRPSIDSLSAYIEIIDVLELELPENTTIGDVKAVEFIKSNTLIHQNGVISSLMLFDDKGKFIKELNKLGAGPGEYFDIDFFLATNDKLILYDRHSMKFLDFDIESFEFLSERKSEYYFIGGYSSNDTGGLFLVSDSDIDNDWYEGYIFSDKNGNIINKINAFPASIEGFNSFNISTINGSSYFSEPFSDKVFLIDSDNLLNRVCLDFGKKRISERVFSMKEAYDFYDLLDEGNYFFAVHNFNFNEQLYSFNYYEGSPENVRLGIMDKNGGSLRVFSPKSRVEELLYRPLSVRDGFNRAVLLPGEYDRELLKELDIQLAAVNLDNPLLITYEFKLP
ncbi:6-bladed beta-propeller [Litoribacter alkaliphilus]|uniref:6-bladed beta-propeller n=1 Tax=Litoribacter ruber TaxID=702568 RepID=A0AAP2G4E9_9BACT|nr:6-bladed beta-propeller [Litoribacter alkaliphilus]MBS9523986.1 6-bladed beta-propeller [Litoribacter alkaliphilus]